MKKAIVIAAAVALLLVGFVVKTFYDAGEFKNLSAVARGELHIVSGVLSSEDITIHPLTGLAFISSADRRAQFAGTKPRQGAIVTYDLRARQPQLKEVTTDFPYEFNPHGIALWQHPENARYTLFVVNHTRDGHFIEIFDGSGDSLQHRQRLQAEQMFSPNDVAAVDDRHFYVTNDHGNRTAFGKAVEEYLQLKRSFVLYYDGQAFREVAGGLAYANGIALSPDRTRLYVAATVDQAIYVYLRQPENGDLTLERRIDLGTGVDNIEFDARGHLWIGAHPKLLTFVDYAGDASVLSPSEVLRLNPETNEIERIFIDDGSRLSGSSVAARFEHWLLIGSVFDPRFLVMKLESSMALDANQGGEVPRSTH